MVWGYKQGFDSVIQKVSLAASLCVLFLISGCTSLDYELTTSSVSGDGYKYADSDPVDVWEGGAPNRNPVHGVDVSKYQGDINWKQLSRQGIEFAFIKATEGGDRLDEAFAKNIHDARRAGIASSAYHFFYFCTSAKKQARWFIRNVPRMRGSMPHVLDMEWNSKSPTCRLRPPAETVRKEMEIFMRMIKRHYGKRPIIYTTVDFHRDNLEGHFNKDVFWLRSVKAHPRVTYPGRNWAFWQYTGTGRINPVEGDIDINVFAGSRSQWDEWLKRATK